jgi:hypothetical protein
VVTGSRWGALLGRAPPGDLAGWGRGRAADGVAQTSRGAHDQDQI